MHKVNNADCMHTIAHLCRLYAEFMQTVVKVRSNILFAVICLNVPWFCRTYLASKGRISAGSFPALRLVEKQEDQGQFGRYAPVQYLEEGTVASPDDSFFAWWCQSSGTLGAYFVLGHTWCILCAQQVV